MVSYASAVTGLSAETTKQTYDALHAEGQRLPDPSQEEVDAFLNAQAFRVRHDPDLSEAKRDSILSRIRAAIGRILPDGATFHAWKNLVAESWDRVRRKASAAFLVGALTFGVGACGNAPAQPAEAHDTAAPVAAAPITPGSQFDTTFDDAGTPSKGAAVAKYGQREVDEAWSVALDTATENSFRDDLMDPSRPLTRQDFATVTDDMTASCKAAFYASLDPALEDSTAHKNEQHVMNVISLAWFDAQGEFQATGPKTVNPEIAKGRVAPVTLRSGDEGLEVTMDVKVDWRMVENGKPVLLPFTKSTTYWLVQEKGDWKIDGWQATFNVGESRPDKALVGAAN